MSDRDDPRQRLQTIRDPEVAADDVLRDFRRLLGHLRAMPEDVGARVELHALALEHGAWDELAALLDDEARAADRPEVAAVFMRELCELHLAQGRANEAEATYRRLRAAAPGALSRRDEAALLEHLADVYERDLDQPFEALSAIERLLPLSPGDAALLERLARLSERVGAWEGAAEALLRVAEAVIDEERAREALRGAAALLRDHGQPARAIELLRRVVAKLPNDVESWGELEAIYERLERWSDLAEARRALAGLADGEAARAGFLRGQARALMRAGSAAGAAVLYAEAAELAPERLETLLERVDALVAAGHGREGVRLLETRMAAGAGDDSRLRLRLAELTADLLGERAQALALVEAVLAEEPGQQAALALLVHLSDGLDAAAAASARLRLANALPDGPAKLATLLEAARRLRAGGHDVEAAVRAYQWVLELDPEQAEATRELQALQAGIDVERALAEARSALAGGRAAEAAAAARAAIDRYASSPAETRGRLWHLLAQARRALGETDEAHRALAEAHRLRRDDLLVTIDLGRSCFDRRLWREAALHLAAVAAHPQAAHHAGEVAAALVLAAQAETRALRPERAEGLFRQAVELDPQSTAAWHGLGEIAMQRGEVARAADCLEHEAAASVDARDRVRLFDALGDLAEQVLADHARAERCWLEATRATPAEAKQLPLYQKLLELLRRERGPGAELAEVSERLAAVHPDTATRRRHAIEAVDAWVAAGQPARARVAAARLADENPLDDEAVALAAQLELETGDHEAAAARLGRALNAWDAAEKGKGPTGAAAAQRAELWRWLGDARKGRGDLRGAETAWMRALAMAPHGPAALGARRGLAFAAARSGRPALEHLRVLVDAEPHAEDVAQLARELAVATSAGLASAEEARAMFELAGALGRPDDEAYETFRREHPARAMASDESYAAVIDERERRAMVDDAEDAPLADVLGMLWEAAPMLVPDPRTALDRAGFAEAERMSPVSHAAAAALYPQLSKALGGTTTLLFATHAPDTPELTLIAASPPVVLFGKALVSRRAQSRSDADLLADAELRFRLGRVVELARPQRVLAAGVPPLELAQLVGGLIVAFGGGGGDVSAEVAAEAERLKKALPIVLRSRVSDKLKGVPAEKLDPMRYLAACERAADRAGMLVCTHVAVALAQCGGPRAAPHLVKLAGSARFLATRKRLRER